MIAKVHAFFFWDQTIFWGDGSGQENDMDSRSKMNKYMMSQGIPAELLDELAGKFHDMPKNDVLKQIAIVAKDLKG